MYLREAGGETDGADVRRKSEPPKTPPGRQPERIEDASLMDVLLGGEDTNDDPVPGTWLFDGVTWTEELPPPSTRSGFIRLPRSFSMASRISTFCSAIASSVARAS